MPLLHPTLVFILLLLTWWVTNNVYAIDAELFFTNYKTPLLYIDLTITQTVLGIVLTQLHPSAARKKVRKPSKTDFVIGSLHFLGCLLTNMSYSLIGSTTTLMWKLAEPVAAVLLKWLVLSEATTPLSQLGVLVTVSGVLRFSSSTFKLPAFSPIILSNIIFPTRNVFIKLSQREYQSPATRFLYMLLTALPLAVITLVPKLYLYGANFQSSLYMLRNSFLFNAYQIASFLLLERLDALTHSLLNTMKRFTGILLSMVVISTPMQTSHYQGIGVTILGFGVYLTGASNKNSSNFGNRGITTIVIAAGLALLALFSIFTTQSFNIPAVHEVMLQHNPANEIVPDEYTVLLRRHYETQGKRFKFTNYEEASLYDGPNVGNFVWQYGATKMLPDFKRLQICVDSGTNCTSTERKAGKKLVLYLPLACALNEKFKDTFGSTVRKFEDKSLDEILIVGIGIQAEFWLNSRGAEFKPNGKINYTSDDFPINDMTKRFLKHMGSTGSTMLLRGDFTYRVLQKAGFQRAHTVGCPSFWINRDLHLGRTLERKYKDIGKRIGDPTLKVAVNVKHIPGFRAHITYVLEKYPLARFYCQGRPDIVMLNNVGVPIEKIRFFTNVEDWMEDLKEMDVSYGVRIHGNMISLAVGLPVLVVASDWRVLELVEAMKLPHLTTFDDVFEEDIDVGRLVKIGAGEFDGAEFDRNRCEIGKVYVEVLRKYGIGVQEHVRRVADSC